MEKVGNRSKMIFVASALVVFFLIPGIVQHMHRYQQMEAMLRSQERANQWVSAKPVAYPIVAAQQPMAAPKPSAPIPALPPEVVKTPVQQAPSPVKQVASKPVAPVENLAIEQELKRVEVNHAPIVSKPLPKAAPVATAKDLEAQLTKQVMQVKPKMTTQPKASKAAHKPNVVSTAKKIAKPKALVQVGVFSKPQTIHRLVKELKTWGYDVYTEGLERNGKKNALQRVLVRLSNTGQAKLLQSRLWKAEKVHASILIG